MVWSFRLSYLGRLLSFLKHGVRQVVLLNPRTKWGVKFHTLHQWSRAICSGICYREPGREKISTLETRHIVVMGECDREFLTWILAVVFGSRNDLTVFHNSLNPEPAFMINIRFRVCREHKWHQLTGKLLHWIIKRFSADGKECSSWFIRYMLPRGNCLHRSSEGGR